MNLSDKAKNTAIYLVENVKQEKISRNIEFAEATAIGDIERVYIPVVGLVPNDFVMPPIYVLEELEFERLIRLTYAKNLRLVMLQSLFDAVENNFGEPMQQPKSQPPQKTYKGLSEEHWNFLVLMAKAIRGDYIIGSNTQGYYIQPNILEGEIIGFKTFRDVFLQAHKDDLNISLKAFLDLEANGYLRPARNRNYYLIGDKILPAVEDYLAQRDGTGTVTRSSAFRLPDTSPQFKCDIFMVMPFREELKPVYDDHIKPIAAELGYIIKRGDDTFSHHDIITEIWSLINNARVIIADCTGKNANVFYELGLAHAIDKPVIIITQDEEDIPFDIRQRRYIKYEYTPRGMTQFEEELKKAIQAILG